MILTDGLPAVVTQEDGPGIALLLTMLRTLQDHDDSLEFVEFRVNSRDNVAIDLFRYPPVD